MNSENASSFIRTGKSKPTPLSGADADGPDIFHDRLQSTLPDKFKRESSLAKPPVHDTIHGRHGI